MHMSGWGDPPSKSLERWLARSALAAPLRDSRAMRGGP
ncbi:hypothetical protein ACS15_0851 [Ralstonia insidiosa]|uniref:Uncharacterized protein n=1 Tax=Ralstonia insidiosa TaxID=190721 RepID=A0AAC9FS81_9RALS|nr:hypothetical protein ACS15_0851 [Ralstonia insidiosa]